MVQIFKFEPKLWSFIFIFSLYIRGENMNGFIYKIVNDINDKVYVGQTRRTL
jgi:hypothetical protein